MLKRLAGVVVVGLLALTACSGGREAVSEPTAVETTRTTVAPTTTTLPPPMPLTGLLAKTGQDPRRPIIAVKVENAPAARPLAGFEQADVVIEEVVEGGFTRFILFFQSEDAELVGPIRSNRPVDADILRQFGRIVLANSGGNFTFDLVAAGLGVVTEDTSATPLFRRGDRPAPHDLYVEGTDLRSFIDEGGADFVPEEPPADFFRFSGFATTSTTSTAPSVTDTTNGDNTHAEIVDVPFASQAMQWRLDRDGLWYRFDEDGSAATTEAGNQVSATNVIVMSVAAGPNAGIDPSGAAIPTWHVLGEGELTAVTAEGRVVVGTWSRAGVEDKTRFLDESGEEIVLTPGVTWIQLLPEGRWPLLSMRDASEASLSTDDDGFYDE